MNTRKIAVKVGQAVASAWNISPGTDISKMIDAAEKELVGYAVLDRSKFDLNILVGALGRWVEWTSLTAEKELIRRLIDALLPDGEVPVWLEGERRLVVIDPEDEEQVERFHRTWLNTPVTHTVTRLQTAFRKFATPPPNEPKGLGAVVQDSRDICWVRTAGPNNRPWVSNDDETRATWRHIDAVKVLSEGVVK